MLIEREPAADTDVKQTARQLYIETSLAARYLFC